jgi:hypothetical protein
MYVRTACVIAITLRVWRYNVSSPCLTDT